jgi:hypothetical protein
MSYWDPSSYQTFLCSIFLLIFFCCSLPWVLSPNQFIGLRFFQHTFDLSILFPSHRQKKSEIAYVKIFCLTVPPALYGCLVVILTPADPFSYYMFPSICRPWSARNASSVHLCIECLSCFGISRSLFNLLLAFLNTLVVDSDSTG